MLIDFFVVLAYSITNTQIQNTFITNTKKKTHFIIFFIYKKNVAVEQTTWLLPV